MPSRKLSPLVRYCETVKSLYYNKVLTSTEISEQTGKSIPYTIKVLNELIKEGYVVEKGYADSRGGRKPINYSLVANTHYILSVAMDQFSAQVVVVDMNNKFVTEIGEYEFDIYKLTANTFLSYLKAYLEGMTISRDDLIGIVVTMPGFVDTDNGINHSFLALPDQTLVDFLQENLSLPVFLDNNSTAIALGEQKFGVASHEKNVMVLNLGWGIGLGMIVDDTIFRGNNGFAGEFSHIPLFQNGKLCTCGKRGCLETEASLIAITANAKKGIAEGQITSLSRYKEINADDIIAEAVKGDLFSVKLISEAAYHVGQGLAILIHLMNPGAVVLSGKGSVVGNLWMAPIQQAINEHCIPRLTKLTEFFVSDLNTKAQLIGGAALMVENFGKKLEKKMTTMKELTV
ncbi:putative NBD/HSP70 family sugar kinase [Pedobacter sp. CAN_A7]|uniref:ROK family protein n=1 Tax=Pedobacter sp. CAN_A7 TaxID=2787722 RepID=UPI0018CB2314